MKLLRVTLNKGKENKQMNKTFHTIDFGDNRLITSRPAQGELVAIAAALLGDHLLAVRTAHDGAAAANLEGQAAINQLSPFEKLKFLEWVVKRCLEELEEAAA